MFYRVPVFEDHLETQLRRDIDRDILILKFPIFQADNIIMTSDNASEVTRLRGQFLCSEGIANAQENDISHHYCHRGCSARSYRTPSQKDVGGCSKGKMLSTSCLHKAQRRAETRENCYDVPLDSYLEGNVPLDGAYVFPPAAA